MKKWFLILLLLSIVAYADDIRSGSITLLALMESNAGKSGSVASL